MKDRYDAMCGCVIVSLTPGDQRVIARSSPEQEDNLKRSLVNNHSRNVIADAD
ncbi:hypothetical protein RYA05_04495 [Pseudomonas syringae pv. actinidiae]|nr:hypothetical protein [Pseudomonas syringae pv. actinidiae]